MDHIVSVTCHLLHVCLILIKSNSDVLELTQHFGSPLFALLSQTIELVSIVIDLILITQYRGIRGTKQKCELKDVHRTRVVKSIHALMKW